MVAGRVEAGFTLGRPAGVGPFDGLSAGDPATNFFPSEPKRVLPRDPHQPGQDFDSGFT
jgi:hypothetical protein